MQALKKEARFPIIFMRETGYGLSINFFHGHLFLAIFIRLFSEIVTVGLHFIKKNGRFNYFKARLHGFMGIRQYSKKRKTYTKNF